MIRTKQKYEDKNYVEDAVNLKVYKKEIVEDWNKYFNNKISLLERFKNYINNKEYDENEIKKKKGKNNVKCIKPEKIIYKYIKKFILGYCEEQGIIEKQSIKDDKEYFLDYIKKQISIKLILNERNNESNSKTTISNTANFKKICEQYLKQKYLEYVEWDEDCYRKRYWEFNSKGKNKLLNQVKAFPEITHFLTMYNYEISNHEGIGNNYINSNFYNIIKDVTGKKSRDYSLIDLQKFYDELEEFINISERSNNYIIKWSIFERIFKGLAIGYICERISKNENYKISDRKLITLQAVLEIKSIRLRDKYIKETLRKSSKLKNIYVIALLYDKIYELIEVFIDILLRSDSVNLERYIHIDYDLELNEDNDISEEDNENPEENDNEEINYLFLKKEEDIFQALKKMKNFHEKNKKILEIKNKSIESIFCEDFESYGSIKLNLSEIKK